MLKRKYFPLLVIAGIVLAFMYVYRDKMPAVSNWVAGGRSTGVAGQPLPDTGGDGSID